MMHFTHLGAGEYSAKRKRDRPYNGVPGALMTPVEFHILAGASSEVKNLKKNAIRVTKTALNLQLSFTSLLAH